MRHTVVEGPDPLLGARIAGRYTVMRRIARGGMGVVYLAVQEGLGRAVALKIIRQEAAADPVMQKRFEREARAASSLSHPSIVTIHDFGRTDDGALYLAMEFVDGEVLRDVLRRKGRLSFVETVPIIESIAAALARAHAAGVVHRDLKPENVILPRQSASTTGLVAAKVLDFGLAKPHDPDLVEENLTRDGGFVGTPGYAAPEQAEGQPEHPRQDLYALGVLWFELLCGEHPFAAPTPMKIVVRQLHEEPPPLPAGTAAGRIDDVPAEAAALVRALMARRPEDRPPSAQAVLDVLPRWKGLGPAVAPVDVVAAPADSLPNASTVAGGRLAREAAAVAEPAERAAPAAPAAPAERAERAERADERAPPVTPAVTPSSPAPALPAAVAPAGGGRGPWLLLAGGLAAAVAGAAVVFVGSGGFSLRGDEAPVSDAGLVAVGALSEAGARGAPPDAPEAEAASVDVVLEDVPTFTALQAVRAVLSRAILVRYTRERSLLRLAVHDTESPSGLAAAVAEKLQGLALQADLPLVLEVKELSPALVVVGAVRPEDASALADAGALLEALMDGGTIADAGDIDVVAPGGLTP